MKIFNLFISSMIILLFCSGVVYEVKEYKTNNNKIVEIPTIDTTSIVGKEITIKPIVSDWDLFTEALIFIESSADPNAVNEHTKATGLFQILPLEYNGIGFLHDWNEKHPEKLYTTKDLFNVNVQWEIFNHMQDRYNKKRCIEKAIKIHNSQAGPEYRESILKKMEELRIKYNS